MEQPNKNRVLKSFYHEYSIDTGSPGVRQATNCTNRFLEEKNFSGDRDPPLDRVFRLPVKMVQRLLEEGD